MERKGAVELKHINKFFGKTQVLKDLDFEIRPGEFLSLLGPSGCGKTTILRLIAGLEHLDGGEIYMDGARIDTLEPYRRRLNTVFQNYALFPHMNVRENIAYGLKAKWTGKKETEDRVRKIVEMVQLQGMEERQPVQMSGGQRQRVAIARAIVNEPPVLLLDEPLTALDLKLRKEMRFELRRLQRQLGITFIYVTHDQEEALVMSDRIAVMNKGQIEQVGTPEEIYSHPVSQFVAEFIGETNVFEAMVTSQDSSGEISLQMESGSALAQGDGEFQEGDYVHYSIRPDLIQTCAEPVEGFYLQGVVTEHIFTGSFLKCEILLADEKVVKMTRMAGEELPPVGSCVNLFWNPEDAVVMRSAGGTIVSTIEHVNLSPWNKQTETHRV